MNQNKRVIDGYIVDVFKKMIYPGEVTIQRGVVQEVKQTAEKVDGVHILPGLVDSHIHIESSMLSPQYFARTAVRHGTVATVSDPHEIANVLGEEGIRFMQQSAGKSPLKFNFGVPSCVPATPFETSGAVLDSEKVQRLLEEHEFKYLAEMMNFPGVVNADPEVMKKIRAALNVGKPVDGHSPGLRGEDLDKYIASGISTDHECNNYEEALEKLEKGMFIQIREGSAARNFDALWPLIREFPDQVMLCSDDRHPNDLIDGHINHLIRKGQEYGLDLFDLLKAAIHNPVMHYGLDVGLLRVNDPADFILVDDLKKFQVRSTYINGRCVYQQGQLRFDVKEETSPNVMNASLVTEADLKVAYSGNPVKVIHAKDHELYTSWSSEYPKERDGLLYSDTGKDILKVASQNRYKPGHPSVGFIRNFGLKKGAIGSSIAHDSHNLLVVGTDDKSIVLTMNHLIEKGGGIAVYDGSRIHSLVLEIAGLMTHQPAEEISAQYTKLTRIAREKGCKLEAPFMTLSFMALPVIPELKLTDQGLFDVQRFQHTSLEVKQ